MKTAIPWKTIIDINTTRNLFSCNNEKLPYEIELYICSCGVQKRIIKQAKKELEQYQCSECGNDVFYDALYYISNHAWYDPIEWAPFYDLLQENLKIEIEYDTDKNNLLFLLNLQIPNSIDISSEKVEYYDKTIYSLFVDKNGQMDEKLMVDFNLDFFIDDHYFYGEEPSQSEVINRHPLLAFFKKQMLQLLKKHPLCDDLALVKYDCTSIKDILFFIPYPHLKEYGFIAWQEVFLLPKEKPLTVKQALDYVLDYRSEKSLKKAVFKDYEKQISSTKKYIFSYIHCVCKYMSDVNIASRMVTLKFEDDSVARNDYRGIKRLFAYLSQTYSQKQIELLMNDLSDDAGFVFFDILEMFSQFDNEMILKIEKVKPKSMEFHNEIIQVHRTLVQEKLFEMSFEYSVRQKRGCVIKEPYSVQLPQNGLELYEWSVTLQNCLSGYGELIKSKRTTVYGFFKDDILHIAVEVKNNQIVQANSKYNQKLSRDDTNIIKAWFDEYVSQKKYKNTSNLI